MIRIVLMLALFAFPALADEAAAPALRPASKSAEEIAVQAWGRAHPDCAEWSDACLVCTQAGCSTPGIACTPREIVCKRP